MKQIVIIGASGHGKVVADIAKRNGYEEILFLDDAEGRSCCGAYPVVGKCCDITRYPGDFVVAIGNADIRQKLTNRLERLGRNLVTLVHPNAVIGEHVEIGKGTVIMAGAVVIRNIEKSGTYIGIPAEDKYMDNMQKKFRGSNAFPKIRRIRVVVTSCNCGRAA